VGELLFPIHDKPVASFSWRPYQIESVQAAQQCLASSSGCLLVLPCGCGKTEIAVRLIETLAREGGALVISPLDTLVSQTASRLRLRGVRCGIEMASLKSEEPVTVASYKSLISRSRFEKFVGVELVIVDESHLNYSKRAIEILTALRDGGAKIVGLTASPDRMTGDPLTEFYGPVPYFYTLADAINDGWLVPPRVWLTVAGELDLSQFDEGSGDFNANRLAREMARDANVQTVSQLVLQHHEDDPSVVFCQGIIQAEKVRQVLARGGVEAAIVHSRMEEPERRMNLSLFEDGTLNVILNVGCLSLGWDAPIVKKVFMCKPTRSRVVYQQAVGRGTRPMVSGLDGHANAAQRRQAIAESSKPFFEIFDLVDASRHNDLVTAVEALQPAMEDLLARRVRKAREGKGPQGLSDLERLVAAEQALMAEEAKQQAREESARAALTERQRAAWLAGVEFSTCERDAFAPAEQRPRVKGWRVTFGKYKGTLLRDVDTGWLHWALAKAHMNPAFRAAVEREVRRRAS
jgi:superfamily II DNA or RNA helicase